MTRPHHKRHRRKKNKPTDDNKHQKKPVKIKLWVLIRYLTHECSLGRSSLPLVVDMAPPMDNSGPSVEDKRKEKRTNKFRRNVFFLFYHHAKRISHRCCHKWSTCQQQCGTSSWNRDGVLFSSWLHWLITDQINYSIVICCFSSSRWRRETAWCSVHHW